MRATVITDASFCPKTKAAGWAAWVRIDGRKEPIKKYGAFKQSVENSRDAEMLAAINGVFIAAREGATQVLVQTDCLAVVHMFEGVTVQQTIKDAFTRAQAKAGILGLNVSSKHVRGHTNDPASRSWVNRWCDEQAGKEMRAHRAELSGGYT